MSKIYLVIESCGEHEDRIDMPIKSFKDITKAGAYVIELEGFERTQRNWADRCRECAGTNKECPMYSEPYDITDGCGSYEPHHDNRSYRIEEIDLEE